MLSIGKYGFRSQNPYLWISINKIRRSQRKATLVCVHRIDQSKLTISFFFHQQSFYRIVTQDFKLDGGEACVNSVMKTWKTVKTYGSTGWINVTLTHVKNGQKSFSYPLSPSRSYDVCTWVIMKLFETAIFTSRYNMLRFFYCYGSFQRTVEKTIFGSRNVTAAMLVWRTILIKVLREFDYTIMQNLSDIFPLFSTPTWPSHHECENPECPTNYNRRKLCDQPIRISSNYLKLAQSAGKGAKCLGLLFFGFF